MEIIAIIILMFVVGSMANFFNKWGKEARKQPYNHNTRIPERRDYYDPYCCDLIDEDDLYRYAFSMPEDEIGCTYDDSYLDPGDLKYPS